MYTKVEADTKALASATCITVSEAIGVAVNVDATVICVAVGLFVTPVTTAVVTGTVDECIVRADGVTVTFADA